MTRLTAVHGNAAGSCRLPNKLAGQGVPWPQPPDDILDLCPSRSSPHSRNPFSNMQARLALEIVFEGAGGGATPDLGAIQGLQSDGNRLLVCGLVIYSLA